MKFNPIIIFATAILTCVSHASTALEFSNPYAGGISSNLASSAGVVTNGLFYGVIVDTSGNGFVSAPGVMMAAPTLGATAFVYNASTGVIADDVLICSDNTTSGIYLGDFEGDMETPGGNGGVTTMTLNLTQGITTGDAFALFWIDPISDRAGILWDPSFVVPSEGEVRYFDQPFVGVDPIRSAGYIYSGTAASPVGGDGNYRVVFAVPEPSAALLTMLAVLGYATRRRRPANHS